MGPSVLYVQYIMNPWVERRGRRQKDWGGCVSCIGSAEISRVSLDVDLGSLWGIA